MKCTVCRGPAVIDLRRHNSNFCPDHFTKFCRDQVDRAIDDFDMIAPGDRVLVAVSGGKDSLAVWDILLDLGYAGRRPLHRPGHRRLQRHLRPPRPSLRRAAGRHPDRGRPPRGVRLRHPDRLPGRPAGAVLRLRAVQAPPVRQGGAATAATTCWSPATTSTTRPRCCSATCCTGRPSTWAASARCCPPGTGSPARSSRWCASSEREMAAYCIVVGIDYLVDECPMAAGNKHLGYKEALNADRGAVTRLQGRLLLRLPAPGRRPLRGGGGGGTGGAAGVRPLRGPHPGRGVRLLSPGGTGIRRRQPVEIAPRGQHSTDTPTT